MQTATGSGRDQATAHPLAELLACPPAAATLLNACARSIEVSPGESVFHQGAECEGLYVIVAGQLQRKAERMETRVVLGARHAGEIVELAAALGSRRHTYTLTAQTASSLMMLPIAALDEAFHAYPRLRMQLLEELAREISRAYISCQTARRTRASSRQAKNATAVS
ncbi:MAG TPA: Crp/Fnr family transcriptional regulator [Terracidiphilus sp.]|nr:Crp/Fnr family transcriptional regulator [Terracidiphilus sp.]